MNVALLVGPFWGEHKAESPVSYWSPRSFSINITDYSPASLHDGVVAILTRPPQLAVSIIPDLGNAV